MKPSIKITLLLLLCNSIAYGQTLQNVMNNSNRTTDTYTHYAIMPIEYISADTAYKFITDYYTPVYTRYENGDSLINLLSPTGSPSPANLEADHVFYQGINLGDNGTAPSPAYGGIGIGMESLYWGGLSSTVPAQEFHLVQQYASGSATGGIRFLTYAGLQDGTNSQLALNARSINVGDGTMTVNLCSQGNNTGGMTVVNTSVNMYAPVLSNNYAAFADLVEVTGTNANGGGDVIINSGSGTVFGQAALDVNATGTGDDANISATASDGAAAFSASSALSSSGANYVAANDLSHVTFYGIDGSTAGVLPDQGYLISNGLNGLTVFTGSNSPILFSTNNTGFSSTAYDMQITTAHNVLIANTENIGGNAVVTGFVSAAKLKITTGANANAGSATLSGGTVTVSTTAVTSSSLIFLSVSNSSSPGFLSYSTIAGTSFTVTSTSAGDGSTVSWLIVN